LINNKLEFNVVFDDKKYTKDQTVRINCLLIMRMSEF